MQNYSNLSLKTKDYDKVRKLFDSVSESDMQWIDWIPYTLESALLREKHLQELFPNLRFVGNIDGGAIVENRKTRKIVAIKRSGSTFKADDNDPQYLIFCLLHNMFRI